MKLLKPLFLLLTLLVSLYLGGPLSQMRTEAHPQSAPVPGIALEPVLTGLAGPVLLTHAGDGSRRLFIVEQTGRIKVLRYGESQAGIFLDISAKVMTDRLGGFLGLAFHPQFASNGRFFVHYLRKDDRVITAEYH